MSCPAGPTSVFLRIAVPGVLTLQKRKMSHNSIKTFVILITVLGVSCIAGAFAGCLCKIYEKIVAREFYPTASPPKTPTSKMHFFCAHRVALKLACQIRSDLASSLMSRGVAPKDNEPGTAF